MKEFEFTIPRSKPADAVKAKITFTDSTFQPSAKREVAKALADGLLKFYPEDATQGTVYLINKVVGTWHPVGTFGPP
jgi:hypothetical protein